MEYVLDSVIDLIVGPVTILLILLAIVLKLASAAVLTPLSVTAAAIRALPSLTDVFSSLVASVL